MKKIRKRDIDELFSIIALLEKTLNLIWSTAAIPICVKSGFSFLPSITFKTF